MLYKITHIIFTIAVLIIGIPLCLYLLKKSIEGFVNYGFGKLPKNYLWIDASLGTYALKILLVAIFQLCLTVWYLFIERGGHLFLLIGGPENNGIKSLVE